jgi:hypothetical protein
VTAEQVSLVVDGFVIWDVDEKRLTAVFEEEKQDVVEEAEVLDLVYVFSQQPASEA